MLSSGIFHYCFCLIVSRIFNVYIYVFVLKIKKKIHCNFILIIGGGRALSAAGALLVISSGSPGRNAECGFSPLFSCKTLTIYIYKLYIHTIYSIYFIRVRRYMHFVLSIIPIEKQYCVIELFRMKNVNDPQYQRNNICPFSYTHTAY